MDYGFPIGPLTAPAIADAFACRFEFAHPMRRDVLDRDVRYGDHTMWPFLPAGHYSDDTQRLMVLGELMLKGYAEVSAEEVGRALAHAYACDPRGYSKRMLRAYARAVETGESLCDLLPAKGDSAGGAMGASLAGLYGDLDFALHFAKVQAEATHGGDGVLAAQITAAMAHFARKSAPRQDLRRELMQLWPDDPRLKEPLTGKPGNKGMPCVIAALNCLENATSLLDLLLRCVELSGDTDTVASIAMGAGWWCKDLPNDLPHRLWYGLEDGPYGRSHLRRLELQLAQKYNFSLRVD